MAIVSDQGTQNRKLFSLVEGTELNPMTEINGQKKNLNNNILIVTDSQSCLLAILYNLFNSSLSHLVLLIKFLIYRRSLVNKMF